MIYLLTILLLLSFVQFISCAFLSVYGVETSAVQDNLTVSASTKTNLAFGPRAESARQPFIVKTKDLSAVKRMVGIDDRIAERVTPRIALPGRIDIGRIRSTRRGIVRDASESGADFQAAPGMSKHDVSADSIDDKILSQLGDDDVSNVRLAARAFVRGNSNLVSSFTPLFERVIGTVTIPVWPLFIVYVSKGSVLEFGSGVNVLVAYKIIIEEGGLIRSNGHLTVNCVRVSRPRPGITTPNLPLGTPFRPIFDDK